MSLPPFLADWAKLRLVQSSKTSRLIMDRDEVSPNPSCLSPFKSEGITMCRAMSTIAIAALLSYVSLANAQITCGKSALTSSSPGRRGGRCVRLRRLQLYVL